jgi:ferredoxin
MAPLAETDLEELQEWVKHVESKEATRWLMLAIGYKQGVDIGKLADWYGVTESEIRNWFQKLESAPLVIAIAEKEGLDVEALAERSGVAPETVRDWFRDIASEPPSEAIDVITRYSQQQSAPVFQRTNSTVHFLDYNVVTERGWSIDDEDLFAKASEANLGPDQYGRIVVTPGESILEAAESRGYSWPYACRAGGCANCVALVTEGDIAMPGQNVLSTDQVNTMNARLTCVGVPVTDEVKIIMNVQHLEQFSDLRLPSPIAES